MKPFLVAVLAAVLTPALLVHATAAEEAANPDPAEGRNNTRTINIRLKEADEKATLGETEPALVIYENLLAKFGKTSSRFTIREHMGKYFFALGKFDQALEHFTRAASDGAGTKEVNPDLDERVEALYYCGMCYVKKGSKERCFPSFRQVIELAPGSPLANQAYFEIGEAHFDQDNFTQAIANFALVGTSLDEQQIGSHRCELGKPLFIRAQDLDLLVADGRPFPVSVTTSDGDKEQVLMRPLRPGSDIYIGTVPTGLGPAHPGDGIVQGTGKTKVTIVYDDVNTADGKRNVPRETTLDMVSDGRLSITDGAFLDPISQVIIDTDKGEDGKQRNGGQINLRVVDPDEDSGDAVDKVKIDLVVEHPLPKDDNAKDDDKEIQYEEKTRTTIELVETVIAPRESTVAALEEGDPAAKPAPVPTAPPVQASGGMRSGTFTATVQLSTDDRGQGVKVAIGDRISAIYHDVRHLQGDTPAVREARVLVVPGTPSQLTGVGTQLADANLKVKKLLRQAEAAMKLGEVYRDMGLEEHAKQRFDEALEACREVGALKGTYDRQLHEETLHWLWSIYLAKGELNEAAQACRKLQEEFPESAYIADSILAMAKAAQLTDQPMVAIQMYQQIAALPNGSTLAPEALYDIGSVWESLITHIDPRTNEPVVSTANREMAISSYRKVFSTFPDSSYAVDALKKIGDFYVDDSNWNQAIDFFEQIMQEYPDAPFIADVLYNLGRCRFLKNDFKGATAAFNRLDRDYPSFDPARMEKAHEMRGKAEKKAAGAPPAAKTPAAAANPAPAPASPPPGK